jgi:UDP-glucuronate 4-epimerase
MNVLLTGGAGFIGSHLGEALLKRGDQVTVLDCFDDFYAPGLKRRNAARLTALGAVIVEGDLRQADDVERAFQAAGDGAAVVHLAARAGVRPSIANPVLYSQVNVDGTTLMLEAARRHRASRFVFASSSSVYGNCPVAPFHEELDVSRPISPYAATKRACEVLAFTHHHLTAMPTAMLRFFTVFGPRQRPDLAISLFMRLAREGATIPVFGDPNSSRDYTYVDDIVDGVLRAYERIGAHGYRVWNLGNSSPVTLRDMLATIERVVGTPMRLDQRPARAGDVERTFADLTRSRAELGYAPRTSFEAGVRRQWEAMCESSPGNAR